MDLEPYQEGSWSEVITRKDYYQFMTWWAPFLTNGSRAYFKQKVGTYLLPLLMAGLT